MTVAKNLNRIGSLLFLRGMQRKGDNSQTLTGRLLTAHENPCYPIYIHEYPSWPGELRVALFLSTYVNKVDKKGRVSVPAQFRAALAPESYQGIVVFRSNHHRALEGVSWSFMEEVGRRLDHFDLFSDSQDDLATAVFGDSVQLPFDGDGRVVLPADLIDFAGVGEAAAFVGLGRKFQIWNPKEFKLRREDARKMVKAQGLTLPREVK